MRILPLSALLLSLFAERSRTPMDEAKWPRPLSGFPLIHRQFRVSYFIQTQNSRLTQSDGVLGAFPHPPTPHQAPGLSAYQKPQPQMLGPLLCNGNARFRKLAIGTLIRIKAVGRRTCIYQNGVQHKGETGYD
jgi:hypothetical protein